MADNTDIRFRAIYDDSDINRALNNIVSSTEEANDAVKQHGAIATTSYNNAAKSADNASAKLVTYKKNIEANNAQMQALNKSLVVQRVELIQLTNAYNQFGDKAGKEAQEVKKRMDALKTSIDANVKAVNQLGEENKVYGEAVAAAGGKVSITAFQAQNLSFQLQDVASQLSTGTSIFRILIQQGPQITSIFGGVGNTFKFFGQQALQAARAVFTLRGGLALLAGGLVALIAIPIILFLSRSAQAAEFFEQKLAQISAAVKVVVDRIANYGSVLIDFIRGQKSLNDVLKANIDFYRGLGAEVRNAAQDAESYTIIMQRMRKEQANFAIEEIKASAAADALRRSVDDTGKSINARTAALKKAGEIEAGLDAQRVKFARKELEDARLKNTNTDGLLKITDEVIQAEKKLQDAINAADQRKFSDLQQLRALRQEGKQAAEEEKQRLKELQDELKRLSEQITALELENLTPVDRLRRENELALAEIDRFEKETKRLYAQQKKTYDAADDFNKLRALTNAKFQKDITQAEAEELATRLDNERKALDQRLADQEAYYQLQISVLDKQKALDLARAENIEVAGISEQEAVRDKELKKLEIEKDYAIRRLNVLKEQYGPDSLEVALIEEQIKSIEAAYKKAQDIDISVFDKIKGRILSALNINDEQLNTLANTLGGALNSYIEFLDATTQAQISAQDRIIGKIDERIQKTEELLNIELERQREGYANSVDALRENLDAQNRERQAAEAKREALERQAAKRRALIIAAQQAAETGLLAVRIFSEAIKTGGFFGVALGIAGLALVTTQIAAAVAQARRVQGFKGGVPYLDGPGTGESDSIPAWLSRGERVVDAKTNAQIGGAQISNADLLKYYRIGVQTEKGIPVAATSAGLAKEMAGAQIQAMQSAYASAANAATDKMIEYWKTRPVEKYSADGSRVIEWKEGSQQRRQKIQRKS